MRSAAHIINSDGKRKTPLGGKRMRSRHQDGWVEERGSKVKRWYGHYYVYEKDAGGKETRRHIGVQLGEKAKLRKWEAEKKLREEIARVSKGAPSGNGQTLAWFARERFLPMRSPQWAPSTRETNLYHIEKHILPALGETSLADLDKFKCQVFINKLAEDRFSFTLVDHCRTMLKAILEEAADAELIGKNPARKLVNPDTQSRTSRYCRKSRRGFLSNRCNFATGSW